MRKHVTYAHGTYGLVACKWEKLLKIVLKIRFHYIIENMSVLR
jgi:hypothetical protein